MIDFLLIFSTITIIVCLCLYLINHFVWNNEWKVRYFHKCGHVEHFSSLPICPKCGESDTWTPIVCRKSVFGEWIFKV